MTSMSYTIILEKKERLTFTVKLLYPGGTSHVPPFFLSMKKRVVVLIGVQSKNTPRRILCARQIS